MNYYAVWSISALCILASCTSGEQYTFKVLTPDGLPINRIGIQAQASSYKYSDGPSSSVANSYTSPDGTVTLDIELPSPDDKLIVTLTPMTPYRVVPQEIRIECGRVFRSISSRYAIADRYEFSPIDAAKGRIAEIRLPESVNVKMKPVFSKYHIEAVRLYRLGGSTIQGAIPSQFDTDGRVSIPVPRGQRSVLFISRDSITTRIEITEKESTKDVDLKEVALDMPDDASQIRMNAVRPGNRLSAVTFVSTDAKYIVSYVVDSSTNGIVVAPPSPTGESIDRTLLTLPPATYYVLRYLPSPSQSEDYDVPAAIDLIATGKKPEIDFAMIEVDESNVHEYRIDVSPDTGIMTATRTQ